MRARIRPTSIRSRSPYGCRNPKLDVTSAITYRVASVCSNPLSSIRGPLAPSPPAPRPVPTTTFRRGPVPRRRPRTIRRTSTAAPARRVLCSPSLLRRPHSGQSRSTLPPPRRRRITTTTRRPDIEPTSTPPQRRRLPCHRRRCLPSPVCEPNRPTALASMRANLPSPVCEPIAQSRMPRPITPTRLAGITLMLMCTPTFSPRRPATPTTTPTTMSPTAIPTIPTVHPRPLRPCLA